MNDDDTKSKQSLLATPPSMNMSKTDTSSEYDDDLILLNRQTTGLTQASSNSTENTLAAAADAARSARSTTPLSAKSPADEFSDDNTSKLFVSPEGKPIRLGSLDLLLSPGSSMKIPIGEAEQRFLDDGILEQVSLPEDEFARATCVSALLFIYCLGLFWDLDKKKRIDWIMKCAQPKILPRLRRLALSAASDKVDPDFSTFEYYFNHESAQRIYFSGKRSFGGFCYESFYRLQQSSNCFCVAACIWFSLQRQRSYKENLPPIDAAHVSRHLVVKDDETFIDRVINNNGSNAVTLARDLTGCSTLSWHSVEFSHYRKQPAEVFAKHAYSLFNDYGHGLVTGFQVQEPFWGRSQERRTGMGYWKFDGLSIDCEGEWVDIKPDKKCSSERVRLYKIWKKHEKEIKAVQSKRESGIRVIGTPTTPRKLFKSEQDSSNKPEADDVVHTSHAMVVLGGHMEKKLIGKPKYYFMLLNSWGGMPLVLVSADYLKACSCTMWFCHEKMDEESASKWGQKPGEVLCTYNGDSGEHSVYLPSYVDVCGTCE